MSRQWQDQDAAQSMWEQDDAFMASLEEERLQTALAALERIRQAGADQKDVEALARELGVINYMKGNHEQIQSY